MKADFEWHKCTILLYPERKDVWRKSVWPIKETVEHLAEIIAMFEPVLLGYNGNNVPKLMSSGYLKSFNIGIEYDDIWIRDTGAVPIDGDELAVFGFDAWSGLYGSVEKDLTVAGKIGQLCEVKPRVSKLVIEGGNLTCDSNGTLFSIKESVLKRNSLPLKEIEEELKRVLDIKQIIWFEQGLIHDETGGHVDNLCVFADKNTVLLSWTDDENNPQYPIVKQALEIIERTKDADGKLYNIIKVPLPDIFYKTEDDCEEIELRDDSKKRLVGEPVQASYVNFVFTNGAVVVPQFGLEQDEEALKIFKKMFCIKTVIPFDTREVILGGGGIHCISRNI